MRTVVVYESMFGDNRQVAQAIAAGLEGGGVTAETVEVGIAPAESLSFPASGTRSLRINCYITEKTTPAARRSLVSNSCSLYFNNTATGYKEWQGKRVEALKLSLRLGVATAFVFGQQQLHRDPQQQCGTDQLQEGQAQQFRARREVILSGGAINSEKYGSDGPYSGWRYPFGRSK